MSFFFALKGMVNAPVESKQYGGLFWFSDLTVCDPYYILPMLTSVTVWATMEVCLRFDVWFDSRILNLFDLLQLGADSAKLSSQGFPLLIYFFRAIPFIMFPITMNFSGVSCIGAWFLKWEPDFYHNLFLGYSVLLVDDKCHFTRSSRFPSPSQSPKLFRYRSDSCCSDS